MSYKTNPIFNRITINKGWKNPYLPTKALNYSRDIALWFKVYLLLKVFLNLKNIQLLSSEIRFDQDHKKILYLVINKKGTPKKKKKLITIKKIQTPLLKKNNMGSIFFLYKTLLGLKNITFWNQNLVHKKVLSRFWLSKPKSRNWLNTVDQIRQTRYTSSKISKKLKTNKNFYPIEHLKLKFYTNKQKQLLITSSRIKKRNAFLYIKVLHLLKQKTTLILQKLITNLKKEISDNKTRITQINQVYKVLLYSNKIANNKKKFDLTKKSNWLHRIQRNKSKIIWRLLKKKSKSLQRDSFLKTEIPFFLLRNNKRLLTSNTSFNFLKKNSLLTKILNLNFLISQASNKNFLVKNYFLFLNWNRNLQIKKNIYTQLDKKNNKFLLKDKFYKNIKKNIFKRNLFKKAFYNISLWLLLRIIKKKKIKTFRKKKRTKNLIFKSKLKIVDKYHSFLSAKNFRQKKKKKILENYITEINTYSKKNQSVKSYRYRMPYRKTYFTFLQLTTGLKLKYLIQDFVQKYFSVQVEAKILHVLNAYKNKNYFRLIFSRRKKKNKIFIKKIRRKNWKQKQIFLDSRLQLATTVKKNIKQNLKQNTIKGNSVFKLKKKKLFVLEKRKRNKRRLKNYFGRISRSKEFRYHFKYFIPVLMDFSRNLDPQILADIIAKVVDKAKKQTWMLNTIKYILQSIEMKSHVGYKIALSGRINSKDKSRLIYITRKQITLQIFKNNMNFAYAQANARIGTFGVKVWVYSKKILKNEKNNRVTAKYKI